MTPIALQGLTVSISFRSGRALFRALLTATFCFASFAAAQDPKIRTTLDPKDPAWVGQRIVLVVELLVPGFFSGTPTFDLPDPPNILIVPPVSGPTVSSETTGDVSYTVQRHELSLFTQKAGDHVIPPFAIRFQFKRNPLDTNQVAATIKTEPIRFSAKLPPGAENLGTILSARKLEARETWKPTPGKAKAGDAFVRVIDYTAPDIPGMAFPPFPTEPIEGLGIYPKEPEVLDSADRGTFAGKRQDTITYLCKQPGTFTIPAARLTWWDLDSQTLKVVDFPSRTLEVAANPALDAQTPAPTTRVNYGHLLWPLAGALVLIPIISRLWPVTRKALGPIHLAPLNPEPSCSHAHGNQR